MNKKLLSTLFITCFLISLAPDASAAGKAKRKAQARKIERCEAGSADHCVDAAKRAEEPEEIIKFYTRACKLGRKDACQTAKVLKEEQK